MAATIQEIAEQAGVSIATASRALNGKEGVKGKTRERVLAAAQSLQYTPSFGARVLVTSQTQTIAYAIDEHALPFELDPMYPRIMAGIQAELTKQGYHLIFATVGQQQQLAGFPLVTEQRVDGVILAVFSMPPRFILELKHRGIPLVLIDQLLTTDPIDAILPDNAQAARLATDHLIQHGHRHIAALLGPETFTSSYERGREYRAIMAEQRLDARIFRATETTTASGDALMQEVLAAYPEVTAVMAVNDAMAIGAIRALTQQGRRVPEDVAVIGFDNIAWGELMDPPLTTVNIHMERLGQLAARRMLDILADPTYPPTSTRLTTDLIVRRSCGCSFPPTDIV